MVLAGVQNVGVIVKKNYQSLMDHLGSGREWDLARKRGGLKIFPPSGYSSYEYHGRIGALKGILAYIESSKEKYVILADCDVVCDLDYAELIERHAASGADVTIAYTKEKMTPALMNNNVSLAMPFSAGSGRQACHSPSAGVAKNRTFSCTAPGTTFVSSAGVPKNASAPSFKMAITSQRVSTSAMRSKLVNPVVSSK